MLARSHGVSSRGGALRCMTQALPALRANLGSCEGQSCSSTCILQNGDITDVRKFDKSHLHPPATVWPVCFQNLG